MTLEKRIPVGAGLGGGSSDAAAALTALNDLWETALSRDALSRIGATLGSDVPFFLGAGTALVTGRGEKISRVDPPPTLWLALAKPAASLSTPDVYREYGRCPVPFQTGDRARRLADALGRHANASTEIAAGLRNDLQAAAIRLCPDIAALQARMTERGALGTLVCGSGSAIFGIAEDERNARRIADGLGPPAAWTAAAHTVSLPRCAPGEESDG
jgi:4-diphosphocytidyl-2-C-methyl-D-erythritol kinase